MTPTMPLSGLDAVSARIASIQSRFAPASGFADVLATAQETTSSRGSGASGTTVPLDLGGASTASAAAGGTPAAYAVRLDAAAPTGAAGGAATGAWASRLPAAGQRWAGEIEAAASKAGVDPALLAALVWAESGFDAGAGSGAGAIGLTQLMPGTARSLGVDPRDPVQNLAGGARYLAEQLDRFDSPSLALAAYNAGPGAVSKHGGIPPFAETRAYVPRVLGYYAQLKGTS